MHFTSEAERLAKRAEYLEIRKAISPASWNDPEIRNAWAQCFDAAFPPIRPVRMQDQPGWAIVDVRGYMTHVYLDGYKPAAERYGGFRLARVELREVEE